MTAQPAKRINNRIEPLLDAAAKLFAQKGYRETTIRDISKTIGMLPGSVYYHFPSKQAILLAVYEKGVERITEQVKDSIDGVIDPWERLSLALQAHLETLLDQSDYARVMIRVLPDNVPDAADELTAMRDDYEKLFKKLVKDLPVSKKVDRKALRFMLLGAANWAQVWYKPGQNTPAQLGLRFVNFLKTNLGDNP